MLSRVLKSAKNLLYVPPAETQEDSTLQLSPVVVVDPMVVTRLQSGDLPANKTRDAADLGNSQSPRVRTPKRKPRVIAGSGSIEDDSYRSSASKKRKIERQEPTKADLEIRTKSSRPVVEIPAMAPIPASELSGSDEVVVDEQGALEEDSDGGNDEPTSHVEADEGLSEGDEDESPEEEDTHHGEDDVGREELEQEEEDEEEGDEDEDEEEHPQSIDTSSRPPLKSRQPDDLAGLLPLELLEDDDISTAPRSQEVQPQAKRIKFTDLVEKMPKDRRIGSTMYRITKARNVQLAPRASSQSRNIKDAWMRGQTGKNRRKNRKPFSKGFLVPKK
ncbi:uncharacterized protein BP5553_04887 [Venustampulla echinocandica]|uniref:Uncharacterized protein n=1 Tax=Venustampulla echinocandica TaxID=2656787 RepID=A0A370TPK6_9HELO|nr:uncharacterized protein BP5553_04887 [Venustampulla echinocandica]RDL37454.1 hypothetical protein BP5553_04887 [Venustampulla echinocandica]